MSRATESVRVARLLRRRFVVKTTQLARADLSLELWRKSSFMSYTREPEYIPTSLLTIIKISSNCLKPVLGPRSDRTWWKDATAPSHFRLSQRTTGKMYAPREAAAGFVIQICVIPRIDSLRVPFPNRQQSSPHFTLSLCLVFSNKRWCLFINSSLHLPL